LLFVIICYLLGWGLGLTLWSLQGPQSMFWTGASDCQKARVFSGTGGISISLRDTDEIYSASIFFWKYFVTDKDKRAPCFAVPCFGRKWCVRPWTLQHLKISLQYHIKKRRTDRRAGREKSLMSSTRQHEGNQNFSLPMSLTNTFF